MVTPFYKDINGVRMFNWPRAIELAVAIAINALIVVSVLQVKFAYLEKTVDKLERIVLTNNAEIHLLKTRNALCEERIEALKERLNKTKR